MHALDVCAVSDDGERAERVFCKITLRPVPIITRSTHTPEDCSPQVCHVSECTDEYSYGIRAWCVALL